MGREKGMGGQEGGSSFGRYEERGPYESGKKNKGEERKSGCGGITEVGVPMF